MAQENVQLKSESYTNCTIVHFKTDVKGKSFKQAPDSCRSGYGSCCTCWQWPTNLEQQPALSESPMLFVRKLHKIQQEWPDDLETI